jgi:RNA polymerase sigma-70 factor (ECF subfamily)
MMDVSFNESELLKGCVSGKKESWTLFVKQYNKLLYHTIYKTLRVNGRPTDPDDINDLFQEVFTSFCENNCKKLRAYDPQKGVKLSSWLRMITVRMTIDHLRKSKPVASLDALSVEPSQAGGQEGLLDEEAMELLREVIEQLSTKDKLLIELFYMKELPPEEIAQILKISPGALYTRKNRVLEKMRKIAGEQKLL